MKVIYAFCSVKCIESIFLFLFLRQDMEAQAGLKLIM